MDQVLAHFPQTPAVEGDVTAPFFSREDGIKITVAGRPNVGKSTLINRLLGYERVITCDQPGTTRDSIYIPLEHRGQRYILIDTAGVRRRAKVAEFIEKISIIKTLQAIADTHLVILLLDAQEGITDQDTHLLGHVLEQGRALVIAVNKWDGLSSEQRQQVRYHLTRKLHFIDFAKIHFISALLDKGVNELFGSINAVWQAACSKISTPHLNQALQQAVTAHQPPMVHGRRIKLRYIHQGGHNPPLFIIHGNQVNELPENYKNYLIHFFRHMFTLEGTPIRLEFRQGENPYQHRKNVLTTRQQKKRRRLLAHKR
jgi:GTP-binding protein